jgi:hypothetical protein
MAGACGLGDELAGFIEDGEFLCLLRTCWFLRKDSAKWRQSILLFVCPFICLKQRVNTACFVTHVI